MAFLPGHKPNFETLVQAAKDGRLALLDTKLTATGESVAVICAVNTHPNEEIEMIPLATLFNDNPYDLLEPPMPAEQD